MKRNLLPPLAVLAAVLAYFTGLYGASASVLGDKFDTLRALFSEGQEFPFTVRAQGLQNAQPLGGGFVMLTDNELSIYAANGALLRTVPHAYARPAMAAGNTRLCLYHRGGTSLTVESRSRTLWEYSAQNAIELCAMSPGGTLAIAQRGQVSVYTPLFEEIFTFYTSEHVTAMAFAKDNKHFAVGCPQPVVAAAGSAGGVGVQLSFQIRSRPLAVSRHAVGGV